MKKIIKKIAVFTSTLTLILSQAGIIFAEEALFVDVPTNHWAYYNIRDIAEKGIVKGYNGEAFNPGRDVTYGEFIKMIVIAKTGTDPGNAYGNGISWAANYYYIALEKGYFTKEQIPQSNLSKPIPRDMVALIVSSVVGEVRIGIQSIALSCFKDVNASTEYLNQILIAYRSGVVGGYMDGTFKPENNLTRAEAAIIIDRLIDESIRVYPSI